MKLNEIIFIVYYNQYTELNQDELKKIANEIQNVGLSTKYKVHVNQTPIITQFDPIVTIEFVEGENWDNVFAKLSINPFQLQVSFVVNKHIDFPGEYSQLIQHSLENIVAKLWEAFNKVAKRQVVERLGLVATFSLPLDLYNSLISRCREISSEFRYITLRLIDVFDSVEPFFESIKVVSNLFIELKLNTQLEPEEAILINDITIPPNSKGVVDIYNIVAGFQKFGEISVSSIQKIYGRGRA